MEFKVVLQFVNIDDARNGNSAFFQDEIFLVDMGTPDDLAQVDPGLGDRDGGERQVSISCPKASPLRKDI